MADELEAREGRTKEFGHLCFNLATMFKDFAFYSHAERRFQQCLDTKKLIFGEDDYRLAET